ncbi:response regulator [Marinobacter subterrani]|uniref:DNA-binding response regulator, OmpR family, contains REC and winged-helix (WHTH) domain n=1 Tax=Marinobacter subterrani TaxID=1658765 RepID=A0A0J7J3W3_9GAMM|nr:response regulator transcription factor [Marinobacter subterrani]KMQ72907.1 DNA-binding response regulator, OmpR family, contains REC and winged-helix (wHTH) domain [Marinobacter subterrani]
MRVLLVEDDELLGDGLCRGLMQEGYGVDWLQDGQSAAAAMDSDQFDVVVLDLMLPRRSGIDVLVNWRNQGITVPILILTALDSVDEKIQGLDYGADDYLVKPVDIGELVARIRALVRRASGRDSNRIECGPVMLDFTTRCVSAHGEPLRLSRHEFAILEALLERPGHAVSRDHLESRLYGWSDGPESNSLEVHIHRLRGKLGDGLIETVRGLGYRFALPPAC